MKKAWSASGRMIANRSVQAGVSLQCEFHDSPTNYTAQFKLFGNLEGKQAEAELTWSVEGNQIRRLISIADGTSIQGTGQNVSIKIRDVSPNALAPEIEEYTASVNVVRGTRGSTSNPPYYKPNPAYAVAGAGGTQNVAVPVNAGVLSVRATCGLYSAGVGPIPAMAVRISQIDNAGNVQSITDALNDSWTPLGPGTVRILIENFFATQVAVGIYFGIDG